MRRRALLLAALCVLAPVLAGCTGDNTTTTGPEVNTTTSDTTPGPEMNTTTTDPGGPTPTPVDITADELRSQVVDASNATVEYVLVSNQSVQSVSNNLERTVQLNQTVHVVRPQRAYEQHRVQTVQGRTVTVDSYLVNGTLYTRSPGNTRLFGSEWTELNVTGDDRDVFEQGDQLSKTRQYLTNATVEDVATVDGEDAYRLDADINGTAYADINGVSNSTTVHSVAATYYVDRETSRLERFEVALNWSLSIQNQKIDQTITGTHRFDYQDATVSLPEAADGAVSVGDDDNETSTNETESTTNETSTNETESTTNETSTNETESTTNETVTDQTGIAVRNGTLAVDPDDSFHRVERALGTNVTDPEAVVIREPLNGSASDFSIDDSRTLETVFGMSRQSLVGTNITVGSYSVPYRWLAEVQVTGFGTVYLRSSASMPTTLVSMLTTHEFVHYVQLQDGAFEALNRNTDTTSDGLYAQRAIVEGAAVYTTDYIRSEGGADGPQNTDLYAGLDAVIPNGSLADYSTSWYQSGEQYVAARVDDPTGLSSVYESPPTTSEQVLHGFEPGEEPIAPLNVSVETGDSYIESGSDRKGEAFIRTALASNVSGERAAEAAAGWGNDTVRTLRLRDGGNNSFVWVQRWDSADDREEFADTAQRYLDSFGTTDEGRPLVNGATTTLRIPGPKTTVFVIGPASLQDGISIEVEDGTVVVETP